MLDVGKRVIVITDKGLSYEGIILARATGEGQASAYRVGVDSGDFEQQGQWHKAGDIFVPEESTEEEPYLPPTSG